MTQEQLQALIDAGDMNKAIEAFEVSRIVKNIADAIKQYDVKQHNIFDKAKRPDKSIKDEDGNVTKTVPVARIGLPFQRKIVLVAAAFLGTPTMESTPDGTVQEDLVTVMNKVWDGNKMDYKFKNIAKKTMSEKQCAELWFTRPAEEGYWEGVPFNSKFKFAMKILSFSSGDELYPVFDDFGDMIAFGRGYKIKDQAGKELQYFDLYTAERFYYSRLENGGWLFSTDGITYTTGVKFYTTPIKKIPVVYYSQTATEWEEVQDLIEALETILSDHNDTNKYNGNPIIFAEGDVVGFSEKGETGKLLEGKNGAKVSYLTWDNAPESIKMEIENLLKFISMFSHTPDTTMDALQGLGYFSTVALNSLFMDAHLKASDHEEVFGEGLQRRINYIKGAIAAIDSKYQKALVMEIKPKFKYFLPENIAEQVDILVRAVQGRILSTETAVSLNPLVADHDAELERIATDQPAAADQGGGG